MAGNNPPKRIRADFQGFQVICEAIDIKSIGVSIVIPTYNEETNIGDCLTSIFNMKTDIPYEVLVVDGLSTDNTKAVVKSFPAVYIENPDKYTSFARNKGISNAKYDLIAFTDADCRVPEDWLNILVKGINGADKSVAGVGGANFAPDDSPNFVKAVSKAQRTFLGNLGSVQGKVFTEAQEVPSIATCNAIYRKKAIMEVGMFSVAHKDLAEDWEMNYRLGKLGYKFMVVPGSFVWHKFRATPRKFFSNMFRYGMGRAILMKKYPESIRLVNILPICFIFGMFLIVPFVLYVAILATISVFDSDEIALVYFLQHFGYAIGEVSGLLFNDRFRL